MSGVNPLDEATMRPDPAQPPSITHGGDSVTTGSLPVIREERRRPVRTRPVKQPVGLWFGLLGLITVLGGAACGVLWEFITPLTVWSVNPDGGAVTTERGLADYIAGDVTFSAIGLVVGLLIGSLVWRWFGGLGWPVVVIGLAAAAIMALACWQMGWWLGPGTFKPRLATAKPGDVLPIELTVRAHVAVLVWLFGAVTPIMVLSSLSRDPEETPVTGA